MKRAYIRRPGSDKKDWLPYIGQTEKEVRDQLKESFPYNWDRISIEDVDN